VEIQFYSSSINRFLDPKIYFTSCLKSILHQDILECVEVLDATKDNSDNVTATDSLLVLFGEGMIDLITFHTNLYGPQQGKILNL
jgi:hypothetical protein